MNVVRPASLVTMLAENMEQVDKLAMFASGSRPNSNRSKLNVYLFHRGASDWLWTEQACSVHQE
jgi:hypothetical protein